MLKLIKPLFLDELWTEFNKYRITKRNFKSCMIKFLGK